ncbi:MAG: mycothiol transferase [Brevibacterium yomogidense]
MDARTLLADLAQRPLQELDLIWDAVDASRLNAHPAGHPNSIAWLVWHSGREIDVQVAEASGRDQVWTQEWADRLGLPLDLDDLGLGHTEAQARAVVVQDRDALRDYLSAVTDESVDFVGTLTEADLAEVIDDSWDPPVTRGVRLISVYADALQHIGQAAYIVGTKD